VALYRLVQTGSSGPRFPFEVFKGALHVLGSLLRMVASILAGVHWPLFLPVAGEPNLLVLLLEAARRLFSDQIACCALAGAA